MDEAVTGVVLAMRREKLKVVGELRVVPTLRKVPDPAPVVDGAHQLLPLHLLVGGATAEVVVVVVVADPMIVLAEAGAIQAAPISTIVVVARRTTAVAKSVLEKTEDGEGEEEEVDRIDLRIKKQGAPTTPRSAAASMLLHRQPPHRSKLLPWAVAPDGGEVPAEGRMPTFLPG